MNVQLENVVVVGVDGSKCATAAAMWAAQEAERRGAELRLVESWEVSVGFAGPGTMIPPDIIGDVQAGARAALDESRDAVLAACPGLRISTELTRGRAEQVLRTASANALMLVVGSHGHSEIAQTLLGSVALRVATRSEAPVVVVRGGGDGAIVADDGPVWVGLDGSPSSQHALAFAFEEASMRGVRMVAVHSWNDEPASGFVRVNPIDVDHSRFGEEQVLIAEQLAGWSDQYPDVTVSTLLVRGRPAGTLLELLAHATPPERPSLVVVGSRGHGGFVGLLLGSTSQALVAHSSCPVAVVRPLRGS